ncbi:glycosyltransferase family 39 protein [Winogradskyella echinorum]|uniref:Glycosyltransferase family 39 protein n=1 Tax=Winogradskyella echinorum TaxID=538189 RepID=A0ABR6XWE6_9FLAO|nr:glycosyltransferase family 39 protein [Winogradskyella echinorum]MBC3844827.1 glycosyltransferase family 39 protein [Winogradskyella echinorum]MBC5749175.1 glycosyltransferase family 39 protein [Winogradskyella echinorum]
MNLFLKVKRVYTNYPLALTISFVLIVLFLLALQGFDVVDEGWYMTFYQQFYNHPETVEYNFAFYLTGIIGGLWYELFPTGGILSFRILAMLCMVSTFVVSYKILSKYMPKNYAIIGLLMILFVNDFGYVAFYYNQLSAFFAVLIIYFLLKGINEKHKLSLLIAGGLTAINVFSRLPNITLFAFSLVFPIQLLWTKSIKAKYWLNQLLVYGCGVVIGFGIIYMVLVALGHTHIMHNAILGILDKGQNTGSNHNFSKLLLVYIKEYGLIIKSFLKLIIVFAILSSIGKVLSGASKFIGYILGVILFACVFRINAIYSLYALGIIGCLSLLFLNKVKPNYKTLCLLALIMMLFLPLGSDGGIHNAGYVCVWLAFPIFFYAIEFINDAFFNLEANNFSLRKMKLLSVVPYMIVGFFILKAYNISYEAYFDKGSRIYKVFSVKNDLAKGIYTTKERAQIFNELLSELEKYISRDDYLLAYDKIPMVNFLTQTKPYMYISWVWVYDGVMFKKQLHRAEEEIGVLPVVVQQKFETIGTFSEPVLDYLSEEKEESYRYNKGRVIAMNDFLRRNHYEIVWSNPYFNIYKPKISNY